MPSTWGQSPLQIPVQGEAGPGLEGFDRVVLEVMREVNIPGASLAVARNGALVLAKGYGLADIQAGTPVTPRTLFALASVSKSLTAITILKLVEAGRLGFDARAFEILNDLEPLPGERVDPRLKAITIRQLLLHTGGWNRKVSGDPNSFSERVAEAMHVPLPVGPRQLARYMMGRTLDFDPGTESQYSNFGYILLGLVIEKVTGRPYEEAVRTLVLQPLDLKDVVLNHVRGKGYRPNEAHRYLPRGREDREGGQLPITMASGGWLAAPMDMVRFLTALDGSRGEPFLSKPLMLAMIAPPPAPVEERPNGTHPGLGWDSVRLVPGGATYAKGGALPGVHTIIKHRADGLDWAFFCNGGRGGEAGADGAAWMPRVIKAIEDEMAQIKTWPSVNLLDRGANAPRS
jgi:N-acyl-D-amino-acid deacylase